MRRKDKRLGEARPNEGNAEAAEDEFPASGSTDIGKILQVASLLKAMQMVLIMICISYLFGLLWYIWCDLRLLITEPKKRD